MKTKIKKQIFINKSIYLVLSILEISKIVMYEFWNDYGKPKYGEKANTKKSDYRQLMLNGYRQHCSLHKSGRHVSRHCKRC